MTDGQQTFVPGAQIRSMLGNFFPGVAGTARRQENTGAGGKQIENIRARLMSMTDTVRSNVQKTMDTMRATATSVRSSVTGMPKAGQSFEELRQETLRKPIRPGLIIPVTGRPQHSPEIASYQIDRTLPQIEKTLRQRRVQLG